MGLNIGPCKNSRDVFTTIVTLQHFYLQILLVLNQSFKNLKVGENIKFMGKKIHMSVSCEIIDEGEEILGTS